MGAYTGTRYTIHISEIDDFLAERLADRGNGAVCLNVSDVDSSGKITVSEASAPPESDYTGGVDFELSTSECRGLDPADIEDYLSKPVFTSSAYEFFDFVLGYLTSFDCFVEFTGKAWKMRVYNPVNRSG